MLYRVATIADAGAITALNHKYHQAYLDGDKIKGFLTSSFTMAQIEKLIEAGEVAVADTGRQIIGYYLTNSVIETATLETRRLKVQELIACNKIAKARYVYHTQAVVDVAYMGQGIGKKLLQHLKELVSAKFDYLIGYIDQENLNAKQAHTKSGWEILTEVEGGVLAITKVKALGLLL